MPESNYKTIEKGLLKGGVAWKHVRRTIRELHHHYLDLVAKAEADGESPHDAAMLAKQRLGTEDQIVQEVLSRPELKSWAHRVPWLVYGAGPVLLYVALLALITVPLAIGLNIAEQQFSREDVISVMNAPWVRFLFEHFTVMIIYPLAIGIGVSFCYVAARHDVAVIWPTIGLLLIAFFGSGFNTHFDPPPQQMEWELSAEDGASTRPC